MSGRPRPRAVTEPASPTSPPGAPARTSDADNDRVLAAISYVLLWITGLIVLLTSKPFEKYKRWHAIQAIALGVVATVLQVAINVLAVLFAVGGTPNLFTLLGGLLSVGVLVLIVVLAVKAHQGEKVRIPVLADVADRNA